MVNTDLKGILTPICKSDATTSVAPGERASFFWETETVSNQSPAYVSLFPPPLPNPVLIGLDAVWAVEPL